MTSADIGKLATLVYELNAKFEEQTDAPVTQITHALQMISNGDDVNVAFLGQTIYSSVEDGSDFTDARQVIHDTIPVVLEGIRLLKL